MVEHAADSEDHVGYVEDAEPLFEPLPQRIDETNESQEDSRDVGDGVVELCNVRGVCVVLLTTLYGGSHWTPKARYPICHFLILSKHLKCEPLDTVNTKIDKPIRNHTPKSYKAMENLGLLGHLSQSKR